MWSRITGYYRPVQNWNDGKVQEYKDRREYNVGRSVFTGGTAGRGETAAPAPAVCCGGMDPAEELIQGASGAVPGKPLLFARVTCPNCRVAESLMDKAGFVYEKLIAEEHPDLCAKYGIKGAPTLVVEGTDGFTKYYGVSEIKKVLAQ